MSKVPFYPHSCEIPGTSYLLEAVDGLEIAMGAPYCHLRVLDSSGAVHIDLSSWVCYPGGYAEDFLNQSASNPHILFIPVLVNEIYRKREFKTSTRYTLKLDIAQKSFRIAERGEKEDSIDRPFYPLVGMPELKAYLETHIHSRRARKQSKFHH